VFSIVTKSTSAGADEALVAVRSAAAELGITIGVDLGEPELQALVADLLGGRRTDHRLRELMRAQGDGWRA
jgi:hypothetical protein